MRPQLTVERLGHINLFTDGYDEALALQQKALGATVFAEWTDDQVGSRNALAEFGPTCIETFAPMGADSSVAKWLKQRSSAWHSLEWTVASLDEAADVLEQRGIRITERTDTYLFAHPHDLYGIALEVTDRHFDGDARDAEGWNPTTWRQDHPLGVVGVPSILVAVNSPQEAAASLADLTGAQVHDLEHVALNAVGCGVSLPDHVIEFVGSSSGATTDLVGQFLAANGQRIFALSLRVEDLLATRAYLAGAGVPFDQFGRHSLFLRPERASGLRVQFTDEA